RENQTLARQFAKKLDELTFDPQTGKPGVAELATLAEAQARRRNDPPLLAPDHSDAERLTLASLVLANPGRQWQRQPADPDCLQVRVGVGHAKPRFEVRLDGTGTDSGLETPVRHSGIESQRQRAREMVRRYEWLQDVPVTISLRDHASVAIVTGSGG